jgi:hypothetical protein
MLEHENIYLHTTPNNMLASIKPIVEENHHIAVTLLDDRELLSS